MSDRATSSEETDRITRRATETGERNLTENDRDNRDRHAKCKAAYAHYSGECTIDRISREHPRRSDRRGMLWGGGLGVQFCCAPTVYGEGLILHNLTC